MRSGVLGGVCVLLSAICLASIASAQTSWQQTYGGTGQDEGYSVQQTTDGGYIIIGWTYSFGAGNGDFYLIKTNAQGDTLWTRTYGGAGSDEGASVQQTADGGYVVVGYTTSFGAGNEDVCLIKTNAQGDTLWTRTYGGAQVDEGVSVQLTTDGGYIIAGWTVSFGAGQSDAYLIKTDAQGDTLWTKTYGGTDFDMAFSVQQTTDGGYISTGLTASFGAGAHDVYLIKTNASGDTLWTRTYGGTDDDWGESVRQTTDAGYIIAGYTESFGAGNGDVYLIKTDAAGDTLWTRTYGGTDHDGGNSVQQTSDGGYIVAGWTPSFGAGNGDVYLIKTNASGDTLWTRTYGGMGEDAASSVRQTTDGGYVISGLTMSYGAGIDDVYLIRTDANLDVGAVEILSLPDTVDFGGLYVPRVIVRDYGLTSGILAVALDIGSSYSQTVQETLVSVPLDTVVFPAWSAAPAGSLPVKCFTSLVGDQNPANDTIRDSVLVGPPPPQDVGATMITSPSSTVRVGDTVIPRARVKNFGEVAERFFGVLSRIGASYSRTANVTAVLLPDSMVELTFAPWVADSGTWAVSCSTMLASDVDPANDKVSSSVQVFPQSLQIAPDQSDRLEAGKSKTYRFYALIRGDTGAVVEVARPSAPTGWSLRLGNATGVQDLKDTDGDGIPDLGYVAPGESGWFSLDVTAPSSLAGDTTSLARPTFLIAGHLGDDTLVADTAILNLTLMPAFSVHNFPNPFSNHTAFVIGLPDDGKASLTIYTRAGERVCRVLENTDEPSGIHVVRWDGVNDNGRGIAPGTYEYLLDYVHGGKTERIRKRLVVRRQ